MRKAGFLFVLLTCACAQDHADARFCAGVSIPPHEYVEAFSMFDAFSDAEGWERLTVDPGVHEYGDRGRDFDAALVVGMGEIGAVADFYDFDPTVNDEQLETFREFVNGPVARRWKVRPCDQIPDFKPPRMWR